MPNLTLEEQLKGYLTAPVVAKRLGISYRRLGLWLDRGLLPAPTVTRKDGLRLFAPDWAKRAEPMVKRLLALGKEEDTP